MKKENKHSGFKMPDGYLENFTPSLLSKLKEEESTISLFSKNEAEFKVPDHYFDHVQHKITAAIQEEKAKVPVLPLYKKVVYMAAASVAILLFTVIGLQYQHNPSTPSFSTLASSDIEAYLSDEAVDLTDYELAEALPIHDIEITDILEHQLQEENIVDYLDSNTDSFEELNITYDE